MASDSSQHRKPINGDVESVIRLTGRKRGDGLIEVALVGHPHRYRVRIDLHSRAPKLIELQLIPGDSPAIEIGTAVLRTVPVGRLAAAAARHIRLTERGFITADELEDDEILRLRPDYRPDGRNLDDAHYRYVVHLLTSARELGLSPREYVKQRMHTSIPTVDRWIRQAKQLEILDPDWSNNNGHGVK
jgi:hypothetical protein